jgi:hypothetical protein
MAYKVSLLCWPLHTDTYMYHICLVFMYYQLNVIGGMVLIDMLMMHHTDV